MTNAPPNLGNLIPSGLARKVIYGTYAAGATIVGGTVAYFLGAGIPLTQEILGAQGVVAYVGIAVGGLALINTSTRSVGEHVRENGIDG